MSRNYDENLLILQDDFYVIALSCVFLLGFNLIMTFLIFFSGMVDWQSGSFWEVFAAEAMRTRGFIWMFASVILANALAAIPKNRLSAIVIPFMFVLAAFIFYALIFSPNACSEPLTKT